MLYLLHGDDTAASRLKFDELITGQKWVVRLDGGKVSQKEIEESLESQELFVDKKIVILENFQKLGARLKSILSYIQTFAKKGGIDIVLWEDDTVDRATLTKLKDAKTFAFTLPKNFYVFLDQFAPKNGKKLHALLMDISARFSEELILYALVKRVRQLLMVKVKNYQELKEIQALQSWQLGKLKSQSKNWTREKLIRVYKQLFELEVAMKTSALPTNLANHLDILILTQL